MHRHTLFTDKDVSTYTLQEYENVRVNRAMLALAKFRGKDCRDTKTLLDAEFKELFDAVMKPTDISSWTLCVEDILRADEKRLQAYQMIYKEIMGKSSETATGEDMLEATFPKTKMGIPWAADKFTIIERFPATIDILISLPGPGM